ncbi:MAG: SMEK domain-containing protein [Xenococcus sp. MO_188.B8]|nr:SMEK domain-containing protein [Xenococcus sp. MO_188.B8]
MKRQDYQKTIIQYLTWLKYQVEENNSINLTDINNNAEDFYCGLLNLIFGYNLVNINITNQNAAAIDLGDSQKSIAIQVTSTSTLKKTKDTVDKFIEYKLYNKYNRLVILNIVEKTNHRASYIGDDNYKLDTKKDIWDVGDLIKEAASKNTLEQKQIVDYLVQELKLKQNETVPKEVSTILNLIECISDEAHPEVGNGYLEEPFPEEKIYKRFKEHSDFLQEKFTDLNLEYGSVLSAVSEGHDYGQVKLRRAARYLRDYSDTILTQCKGNPREALAKIISSFEGLLTSQGYEFDYGAAEFYIIKELIKCNVFPLRA